MFSTVICSNRRGMSVVSPLWWLHLALYASSITRFTAALASKVIVLLPEMFALESKKYFCD